VFLVSVVNFTVISITVFNSCACYLFNDKFVKRSFDLMSVF